MTFESYAFMLIRLIAMELGKHTKKLCTQVIKAYSYILSIIYATGTYANTINIVDDSGSNELKCTKHFTQSTWRMYFLTQDIF